MTNLLFSFAYGRHSTVSLHLKLMNARLHERVETSADQKVPKVMPSEGVECETG